MLQKVLAWSTLALAMLFVVLSLTVLFAGGSLGGSALTIVAPIAIGSLAVSILLAVTMLVIAMVQ
jgi:ABC-type Co2+ transport system permease subunit